MILTNSVLAERTAENATTCIQTNAMTVYQDSDLKMMEVADLARLIVMTVVI